MIASALWSALTPKDIEAAKKSGKLFDYKLSGRRSDNDALFQHKHVLDSLLTAAGSTIIDKKELLGGLEQWAEKMPQPFQLKKPSDDAYALKLMLMQVARIKRNMTTGVRLSPWLRDLIQKCDVADVSTTDYDENGAKRLKVNDSPEAPKKMMRRRSVLMRMPTTPSPRLLQRCVSKTDSDSGEMETTFAPEADDNEDDDEEAPDTSDGANQKFVFFWLDSSGPKRESLSGKDRKIAYSREYHKAYKAARESGANDDEAKEKARMAARGAVASPDGDWRIQKI